MLRYINFQFATLRKKFGPYVIIALSLLITIVVAIIQIKNADSKNQVAWVSSIDTFTKFFPFVLATLFSALVIAHIFKEGESDGSELIVVAKPLTRRQIVLGKFILSLLYILAFQVFMLLGYIIIAHVDKLATEAQRIKFSLSMFVGGIIVEVIASAIIILLASIMGKVGTIVISILFAVIIPILSFIMVPLGKGWGASDLQNFSRNQTIVDMDKVDTQTGEITSSATSNYKVVDSTPFIQSQFQTYHDKRWYQSASYFDVWYHWGRFYSMFTDNGESTTSVVRWDVNNEVSNDKATFTVDGKAYVSSYSYSYAPVKIEDELADFRAILPHFKQAIEIGQNKDNYNQAPLVNRLQFISSVQIDGTSFIDYLSPSSSFYDTASLQRYSSSSVYRMIWLEKMLGLSPVSKFKSAGNTQSYYSNVQGKNVDLTIENVMKDSGDQLFVVHSYIQKLSSQPWVPNSVVIPAWLIIGLFMCGGALWIYSRRDFK